MILIPSPVHIKHLPPFQWSQWNVEFPDKKQQGFAEWGFQLVWTGPPPGWTILNWGGYHILDISRYHDIPCRQQQWLKICIHIYIYTYIYIYIYTYYWDMVFDASIWQWETWTYHDLLYDGKYNGHMGTNYILMNWSYYLNIHDYEVFHLRNADRIRSWWD